MLSFSQFMLESGDSSYSFKKVKYDPTFDSHTYEFDHPSGKKFAVKVTHEKHTSGGASVHFYDTQKGGHEGSKLSGEHPRDAHKILSTVHKIVRQHKNEHPNISHYSFTSSKKEPSRVSLYKKFTEKHGGKNYNRHDRVLHNILASDL